MHAVTPICTLALAAMAICALPLHAEPTPIHGLADVSPHNVGDLLDTVAAQALIQRFEARPRQLWREPSEADIPLGPAGDQIREGMDLLRNTSRRVGVLASDPAKRLNWNNLNCVNCHQAGPSGLPGTKPYALPLVNAINDYPKYDPKSGKILSLEQRTLGMFGKAPVQMTPDKPEFQAVIAYLRWLSQGSQPGHAMEGSGLGRFKPVQHTGDPVHGKKLYEAKCQTCHGSDLQGVRKPDFEQGGGYQFPPLAGSDTYDNAGHMFAVPLLARYIRATMPFGASWQQPQLTPEQALDIATYVNDDATPRRQNSGRTKAYLNPDTRPQGFAIPENFTDKNGVLDSASYLRAKNGPFKNINEDY